MLPICGGIGVTGWSMKTTSNVGSEVHPTELVTE